VAIATAGSVYTSLNGLRQLQHPSIWSLRHDASCIGHRQTHGSRYVGQMAVYVRNRLGEGKLCNATRCQSICQSPTLADNREVLEHCYAAKQHLVHSIWGTHKGDIERGILKQRLMLDITCSNWYQVRPQVDKVGSHLIHWAREIIAELYCLHCFESNTERLESIDSLLADHKYLFPVAEHVEGGVHSPNPINSVSKGPNEWPGSTSLPGWSNPGVMYIKFHQWADNRSKYADGLYNSIIDNEDC